MISTLKKNEIVQLYSYIVAYDYGFAPNPFYGYCTLANCKPIIRRGANIGDWIMGCGSADKTRNQGGKLVYAMEVTEIISFGKYSRDKRFSCKKPNSKGSRKQACGDNIYYKYRNEWKQRNSFHSNKDGCSNRANINLDTSVDKVLISKNYVYFGAHGPEIPDTLVCPKGRGHRRFSSDKNQELITHFLDWLDSLNKWGLVENPSDWNGISQCTSGPCKT